jgi:hypothetical protein
VPIYVVGTVKDGDGKSIAGARVRRNGTIGYATTYGNIKEFSGHAVTDRDGAYKFGFKTKPGTTVVVTDIAAEANGYVALREKFNLDELTTTPETPGRWDFTLARGEVIAGELSDAKGSVPVFVRGPSFTQLAITDGGGAFRLWVPKGRYTVPAAVEIKSAARDSKLKDTEYATGLVIKRAAVAKDVASGTEWLVLKAP